MSTEMTWNEAVEIARSYINAKHKNQMMVAELACKVCDSTHGGDHKRFENQKTQTSFAKEIGVGPKTLNRWIIVYKKVFQKLPETTRHHMSFIQLQRVSDRITAGSPKKTVCIATDEVINLNSIDIKIKNYLQALRGFLSNFTDEFRAKQISKETAEEVLFYCEKIMGAVHKNHPGAKAADHSLAYQFGGSRESRGIRSIDRSINTSDERVYGYLLKFRRSFISPTNIGRTVGKQNPNSQTSWALIRLKKLMKFGLCEKNDKGHYRAIDLDKKI